MATALKRASFVAKEVSTIPKGAKVLKKESSVRVEEIENGFLVTKNTEIKYQIGQNTDWNYMEQKYYSKTNPLEIDVENIEKSLADNFE